jgi:hypothetical protein
MVARCVRLPCVTGGLSTWGQPQERGEGAMSQLAASDSGCNGRVRIGLPALWVDHLA